MRAIIHARGYDAASLDVLCEAAGISRPSFCNTFGSKPLFYLDQLARSVASTVANAQTQLAYADIAISITGFFYALSDEQDADGRFGSFALQTASVLQGRFTEVHELLHDQRRRISAMLTSRLNREVASYTGRTGRCTAIAALVSAITAMADQSATAGQLGSDRAHRIGILTGYAIDLIRR